MSSGFKLTEFEMPGVHPSRDGHQLVILFLNPMTAACTRVILHGVIVMSYNNSICWYSSIFRSLDSVDISNVVNPFQKHLPSFEMRRNYKTSEIHAYSIKRSNRESRLWSLEFGLSGCIISFLIKMNYLSSSHLEVNKY